MKENKERNLNGEKKLTKKFRLCQIKTNYLICYGLKIKIFLKPTKNYSH